MKRPAILAVSVTLALMSSRAQAADCTLPPSNALSLATTHDGNYLGWCNSLYSELHDGLHLEADDWTDGYGMIEQGGNYVAQCDANAFLARLINAAFIVREVQKHAVPFGEHRWVNGLIGPWDKYDHGYWWTFASSTDPDEWEPSCATDAAASNHSGIDDYIALKLKGAYQRTAISRSSIVVHEPTHEDIPHVANAACANGGSCDDKYTNYNANTMHINFLYDAAGSYVVEDFNGQTVRPVQALNGQCSLIPRFLADEREEARSKAETDRDTRFQFADPPGVIRYASVAEIDAARQATFACAECALESFDFNPNLCEQKACNEVMNSANSGKNLLNKVACSVYNSKIDEFSTPATIAAAKADFDAALQQCLPADPADSVAYCNAEKASASNVSQIDSCGWLDSVYSSNTSKLDCVQQFCKEKFVASGGWSANQDPYGCMDYLCDGGGGSCGDAGSPQACKEQFVMAEGDREFYVTECESDQCKAGLVECLAALHAQTPPAWSYGEPIPESCWSPYHTCTVVTKLAAKVWIEFEPFIGPGPIESGIDPKVSNPAANLPQYMQAFRDAVNRGASDSELEHMAKKLTSQPELISALYNAAPEEFVGMFGSAGFEPILGPAVGRVQGRAIAPERLTERGRAALIELQALVRAHGAGTLKGAIGTFQAE